jgi:hypothetical protein
LPWAARFVADVKLAVSCLHGVLPDANSDDDVFVVMHTFSPVEMWISGLERDVRRRRQSHQPI